MMGLDDAEVGSVIGWLACEDKIQFEIEHHDSKDEITFVSHTECIF